MSALENRIPPPLVLLFTLILIKVVSKSDSLSLLPNSISTPLGIILILLAVAISVSGVLAFKKASTTVNPLKPDSASTLVTVGIFNVSRNPMYLGMATLCLAASIYLNSPVSIALVIAFVLFINRFQIQPEERAMNKLFGDQFVEYSARVRRWL